MKTIIIVIVAVLAFMYISGLQISFKPFGIQLPYWHRGLGLLLIVIGLILFNVGEYAAGYSKGLEKGIEITIDKIKNLNSN